MNQNTQLQKQLAAAQRLHNEMYNPNTSEEAQVTEPQGNTHVEQTIEAPMSPEETPQPVEQHSFSQEASIDWEARAQAAEQRYKVLQGKYNKEVVEARNTASQPNADRTEVMQLQQQIQSLQQTIAQMQSNPAPQPQEQAPEQFQFSERANQVREDYGEELFDTILDEADRRAQERVKAQVNEMQQSLSHIQQDSFGTKKALLAQHLLAHRINFDEVNNDKVFHDWLKMYDPQTGVQRQARLSGSFDNGDLNTVASMFIEFVNGSPQQPQSVDFQQHVQQPSHAPAGQTAPQSAPIYTPQMIKDFYDKKRRGHYSKEEGQRIEREIFQSMKR